MSTLLEAQAKTVYDLGIQLPADSREVVALQLLESIDYPPEDPEEVKRAWQIELQRRVDEIESGRAKTFSLEESMAYLRQVVAEADES